MKKEKTGKDQFHRRDWKSDLRCTTAKATRECWNNYHKYPLKSISELKESKGNFQGINQTELKTREVSWSWAELLL